MRCAAQLSSAPARAYENLISVYCVREMRRWILVYHNRSHTHYTHIGRCNALFCAVLLFSVLFVCESIIMNNKRKSSHPFLVETDWKFIVMSAKNTKNNIEDQDNKYILHEDSKWDRAVWHRNAAFKLLDFPNRYKQQYSHNSALVCLQYYVYGLQISSGAKTWMCCVWLPR